MEDFAKAKKDIKKFLEDKLLPGQSLLSQFGEDLKRDKRKFEESIVLNINIYHLYYINIYYVYIIIYNLLSKFMILIFVKKV